MRQVAFGVLLVLGLGVAQGFTLEQAARAIFGDLEPARCPGDDVLEKFCFTVPLSLSEVGETVTERASFGGLIPAPVLGATWVSVGPEHGVGIFMRLLDQAPIMIGYTKGVVMIVVVPPKED
jgi:hypothetical protein